MTQPPSTAGWAQALAAALAATTDEATLAAGQQLLRDDTPLNVAQGFAISKFRLPDARVVRPRLVVAELTTAQWDRVDAAILELPDAATIAGTTAISDELINPHQTAGIPLVPAPEDISLTCTCSTSQTSPCPHSAAVGLLLTDRLKSTPALIFTLRGRPHQHLKKQLNAARLRTGQHEPPTREHPAVRSAGRLPSTPGAVASAAPPAIPDPVDLNLCPQPLAHMLPLAPPAPLPDLPGLNTIATDAAHRAQALLDGSELQHCPDTPGDIARLTALPHGAHLRPSAMEYLGLDVVSMGHLQLAYAHGGPAGVSAYLEAFTIEHDVLAQAQAAIQPLRPAPMATVEWEDNRLTDIAAGVQLRYGLDARWHPYRAPFGIWQPVPGPDTDPAKAYRAARSTNARGSSPKTPKK
ncbi:hypothetical protein ACFVV7_26735 [Streptomyces globisporus]|uniref:hypothetical protein n=1 Tax=Streptomyces globisporus TaxID=1908 RepID=UPI0036DDA7F7